MSDKTEQEKFHQEVPALTWGQKVYVDRYRVAGAPGPTIWISVEDALGDESTLELSLDEATALEGAIRDAREFQ